MYARSKPARRQSAAAAADASAMAANASSDEEPMDDEIRGIYADASPEGAPVNYQGAGHQCAVCFKVFLTTKGLVQHSIIHTDKKPFECEICHKAFRFKSNLFEHRSIHSGEQPFVCPYCGKACRLKGNLKKHLKTHVRDPSEIEQAYEAVTSAHASANSTLESSALSGNVEYIDESYDEYRNTPPTGRLPPSRNKRRSNAAARNAQTKKESGNTVESVLIKVLHDENNEPLMQVRFFGSGNSLRNLTLKSLERVMVFDSGVAPLTSDAFPSFSGIRIVSASVRNVRPTIHHRRFLSSRSSHAVREIPLPLVSVDVQLSFGHGRSLRECARYQPSVGQKRQERSVALVRYLPARFRRSESFRSAFLFPSPYSRFDQQRRVARERTRNPHLLLSG